MGIQKKLKAHETFKRKQIKKNKKIFPEHSALKGLPTNTITKNPIFHDLK